MANTLTAELHQFIGHALAHGREEPAIISDLVNKFSLSIAESKNLIELVSSLIEQAKSLTITQTEVLSTNIRVSAINPYIKQLKNMENVLNIDGRRCNVLMTMVNPEVVLIDNFLDPLECQHLIDLAEKNLTKSTVAVYGRGESALSEYRTSESTSLLRNQDDIIKNIENRISTLFNWNKADTEELQILRYNIGEQYKPHHDFFADNSAFVKGLGERVATLILYLEEPIRGGTTFFPELNLHVHCKKGSVLFFTYPSPTPDSKTLHAGSPVLDGVKWIATKWFRSLDKQI